MNKFAIIAIISAATALTACSKPTTEVKPGDKKISAAASSPQASAAIAPLATDSYAALKADIVKIQEFGMSQQQKAAALEQRMSAAVQKQDKAELKKLLPEFKAFVNQSNSEFNALDLASSEAKNLRSKMTSNSLLGVEMSEKMLADKPDQKALEALQQQVMTTQKELMAISQDIHNKIAPPQAAASADAAASTKQKAH